ncbi:chemotaxis protein CheB [Burkholderia sp. KK1]|uniref:chemotaxis protein CheB n=1 Tax=Caballeronia sp. CLC5 TaxID=2906764 RepID=UPI0009799E65|nr:chemotaxis protein CheB [Caballeronia sp. CLC5]AQH02189.1 chemotaxis protein CheB [Burkholderia sp. KK1]MCE4574359.1 chemotaxis protein CheB [Caballeronia sp. CLC5]BBP99743.1 chemotaxis protein-glutamate methylesterase [Burkholderia sp. SFA1]
MAERDIVVIGASRGGFQGLKMLVSQLPADLPAAVFIVLHIGRHASVLPDLLSAWGPLTARYATHGETVQRGTIRVAPPDRHLVLSKGRVWLNDGAKENFARPAADPLFRSAALEYGPRVIGVVMSGDLDDGAAGLANIRAQQGFAIVQDPADCESPGMPRAALESCGADALCPEHDLSRCILDAVKGVQAGGVSKEAIMSKDVLAQEARIAASGISDPAALDEVGERSALTCPDCGGALWRIKDDRPMRYRCHTGHAFTGLSLEDGIESRAEEAVWSAIRAVHERVIFAMERQRWAERSGNQEQIEIEQARIEEAERVADLLREAMQVTTPSPE